jgi:hypothetical protein
MLSPSSTGFQRGMAGMAHQRLEHLVGDLTHVMPALAQVIVLDGLELRDQGLGLLRQGPFGIAGLPRGSAAWAPRRKHRVGQEQAHALR